MVHSGYEASGVNYTFGSIKGLLQTAKAMFFDKYPDPVALELLDEWQPHAIPAAVSVPVSSIARRNAPELQK
jgi:hypothetical protein